MSVKAVGAAVVAATAVAFPAAAGAKTIELGWREHDGIGVMSFTVSSLSVAKRRWSVRASFTNHSSTPLRIERRFALLVYRAPGTYVGFYALRAVTFRPALPATLGRGRTWRGSFGGAGTPVRRTFLRVRFGRFSGRPSPIPEYPTGFSWITSHSYAWR